GDMGVRHQHFQFGTGAVSPLALIEGRYRFDAWMLSGYALTIQSLYENARGYQAGDRYALGVFALSPLGTGRWQFRAGSELQAETAELWDGMRNTTEGNQGRVDWLGSLGVSRDLGRGMEASVAIKIPLVTHVV